MRTKIFLFVLVSYAAFGAPLEHTKVGNGDDGSDLEGAVKIVTGPIADARQAAVRVLERLQTPSIPGLGYLIPEVERATLYLAKRDVKAGHYARTIPEPHAPTRFFPSALKLDRDQLIALHIHEGLHRALPESIRTDEEIVGEITLALTVPEATTDRVMAVVQRHLAKPQAKEDADIDAKSSIGYGVQQYVSSEGAFKIDRMHHAQLELIPFVLSRWSLGLGLQASILEATGGAHMGPLTIAPRLRFLSQRGYDVSTYVSGSFPAFASDKTRQTIVARDVYTIGFSVRKEQGLGFFDIRTGWSFVGSTEKPLRFGSVLHARAGGGLRFGKVEAGAYSEIHLAGFDNIGLGTFSLFTAGPECWYVDGPFAFGVTGRFILSGPEGVTLDRLGSLAGYGAGKASLGLNARWSF